MRRSFKGEIVSAKMEETAVVKVTTLKTHPKYLKRIRVVKKFSAHNPENKFQHGDKVLIEQTRPLSKTKRFIIREKI